MAGPTSFPRAAIFNGVDPFVRADDFATGDGTIDDTAALQAAINAAYGKLLYVPKGTYILSQNASTGYCLRIMDSVSILMEPGAVLKLATSAPNTVNAIQIGDGATAVSGVTIEGGTIDGDAVANGGSYSIAPALICASGPVQRVTIRNMVLRNALGSGLVIDGQSTESRAKQITVEDCIITEVAEGVRFQKCDEFHMRGGSITKIKSQDCFEPHGALNGWSLRDCYIAEPHPTNSAIEIYPQYGDIQGGLIENCTIVSDEIRISLSSGTSPESYEARDVTVRNCHLKNSQVFAGVGGKLRNIVLDGNVFEGPSHVTRGTSSPQSGIRCNGANNTLKIINNKISGYQSCGITIEGNDSLVSGNEVFNNGQNDSIPGTQRFGVLAFGDRVRIVNNTIYDNQETMTQLAAVSYAGNDNIVSGNNQYGHKFSNLNGKSPLRTLAANNQGGNERLSTIVSMSAGDTTKVIDTDTTGIPNSIPSIIRPIIQPLTSMAPATHGWITRSGGVLRLRLDAAPSADVDFLVVFEPAIYSVAQP